MERGETDFQPLFYDPTWEYDQAFLEAKRKELKRLFAQEYPMSAAEAFLTSGDSFFDTEMLRTYLEQIREPIREGVIYA